jgi:hypothetical protein
MKRFNHHLLAKVRTPLLDSSRLGTRKPFLDRLCCRRKAWLGAVSV